MQYVIMICFFLLAGTAIPIHAQSKQQIKQLNISSVTETTTLFLQGKDTTYISGFTKFNKDGKTVEEAEYDTHGGIIKKELSKYDGDGNKIEEFIFESEDTPKRQKKTISKFDLEGNKKEDLEYDVSGKLIQKQQFLYDAFNNKKQELKYNAEGKLIRKIVYKYDSNGLRIERKEYDGNNVLISERRYAYTF